MSEQEFVWQPNEEVRNAANWTRFIKAEGLADYAALESRANSEPDWFWNALIRHLDIRFYHPYEQVVDLSQGIEHAKWCIGGRTNFVLNALDKYDETHKRKAAIVWDAETGEQREWTYAQLDRHTCQLAAGLVSLGLKQGDVVGLYMPLVPEAVSAMLALAKLGCIGLPLFSGFGKDAIASRLQDGQAVAVITVDHTIRRGKRIAMKQIVDQAAAQLPLLQHIIVAQRGTTPSANLKSGRDVWMHELVAGKPDTYPTAQLPAEHPMLLVFTSGTSGRPKGTVHTHCGLTTKASLDYRLCWDIKSEDRFQRFTDFGWFAGPMMVAGTLLAGATLVLAEGTPDFPQTDRLWRMIQTHRVTFLGLGPTLARSLRKHGETTPQDSDLSSLRAVASSGESWDTESWLWVFRNICKERLPLMNYCGGTEMGGLLCTNILFPMKAGSFNGPIPGTGADIVDAEGNSLPPGQVGELVMRSASIGTTRGLWQEPERYLESYWSAIPGMWSQGDAVVRDSDGIWYVLGRSDDTIKIAGKRTGPAEIEDILVASGKVAEAAAVGLPDSVKGAKLVCAAVLRPGFEASEAMAGDLAKLVAAGAGSSFRPERVLFVSDLPKTRNLKVMRRIVRNVLLGQPPGDLSALVNPESIDDLMRASAQPPVASML